MILVGDYILDMFKSIALLYVLLFAGYSNHIFTVAERKQIVNNKIILFFITFFVFYFSVTLFSQEGNLKDEPPIEKLINTCVYFVVFLLTTRLNLYFRIAVLYLIFMVYFIKLNEDFYFDKKDSRNRTKNWLSLNFPVTIQMFPVEDSQRAILDKVKRCLFVLIIILIIIGFIVYAGQLRDTGGKITLYRVFLDTSIANLPFNKSVWNYFKQGLGVAV